jgi:hypothetical protein
LDDNGLNAGTAAAVTPDRADAIRTGGVSGAVRAPRIPLGAELPIFCERCGYSLNALPQIRCEHCDLLQFHCPECGHHQPINTLRPALQRHLGRLRSLFIGLIAFFKLNWFGWHLFFWVIMGYEWAYTWDSRTNSSGPLTPNLEAVIAFAIYGFVIGFISRLMLLRWRSGALVGVVLGALFATALVVGFQWRVGNRSYYGGNGFPLNDAVLTPGRMVMTFLTFVFITAFAAAAWPLWVGFVRVAMPERAGNALLEWQRSLSDPSPNPPARLSDQP